MESLDKAGAASLTIINLLPNKLKLFSRFSSISIVSPYSTSAVLCLTISHSYSNHILSPALAVAQPGGSLPEPAYLQTTLSL